MWWALIEKIAEEMAGEKKLACCIKGYHVYKDTWAAAFGEVLVCSREPTNAADRNFHCKLTCILAISYVSCIQKYFTTKKKRITVLQVECKLSH